MAGKKQATPMMQQYQELKDRYSDAFLFFRLGDFYELFNDDALKAARLLEITLTSRNKNADEPIPMCGVPYHSADNYIRTLIGMGYKVAIAEQLEDPKLTKGMVKRDVVRVLTPGTYIEEGKAKENNYLTALYHDETLGYALAYADLGTGEFKVTHVKERADLLTEFSQLQSLELVFLAEDNIEADLLQDLEALHRFTPSQLPHLAEALAASSLLKELNFEAEHRAGQLLLTYVEATQFEQLDHLQAAEHYDVDHYLHLDHYAKRNLELTSSIRTRDRDHSLFAFLDLCQTAMGSRLLKQWLNRPLLNPEAINHRQEAVAAFLDHYFSRLESQELLKGVYDLERLVARVAMGQANPRQLLQLKMTLERIPALRAQVADMQQEEDIHFFRESLKAMQALPDLVKLLDRALAPDAGATFNEGEIIRTGFNDRLDTYRDTMRHGQEWLLDLQQKERQETGIKSLKIGYNKVFGYYIEVTKANLHLLPEGRYERKQTLTNAERYITPALKEMEQKINEAEAQAESLEYELFVEVREEVKTYQAALQALAHTLAALDVLQAFAQISEDQGFTRPELTFNGQELHVKNSRHPVVEGVVGRENFVPNSIDMTKGEQILLITGPNMSGKSTFMRQLGLIVILAQMGCFVPAETASLPIFDRIFTRIGASDDLSAGQSTFMVEMIEANQAIQHATDQSLLLFDELGRGTSTFDGIALAQAIIEYLHAHSRAKVLFSTHYHELTHLEQELDGLKNIHVGVREEAGEVTFLHKIYPGAADRSYGIHVGKLAGLPADLLHNAEDILEHLSQKEEAKASSAQQLALFDTGTVAVVEEEKTSAQDSWRSRIHDLSLEQLTPLEALNLLASWQDEIDEEE